MLHGKKLSTHLIYFRLPKICDIFIKEKILCFSDFGGYCVFILLLFHNCLRPNWCLYLKWIPMFVTVLPIIHEHPAFIEVHSQCLWSKQKYMPETMRQNGGVPTVRSPTDAHLLKL